MSRDVVEGCSWLARLTLPKDYDHRPIGWLCRVFSASTTADGWGYRWSVASDARGMLAICDGGLSADPAVMIPEEKRPLIRDKLTAEPPMWMFGTLSRIWRWVGYSELIICPFCSEWEAADLPCEECGGRRVREASGLRAYEVGGLMFDADLIARYLAPQLLDMTGEPIRIGIVRWPANVSFLIIEDYAGATWRVVIADVQPDRWYQSGGQNEGTYIEDRDEDTRVVLADTPFAGQVDAALVAADWLEEAGRERDAAFLRQIHGEGT